jgi:hypothetical protein
MKGLALRTTVGLIDLNFSYARACGDDSGDKRTVTRSLHIYDLGAL